MSRRSRSACSPREALIETVAAGLKRHKARNIVLDPVMVAASGAKLLEDAAIDGDPDASFFRWRALITPNLPEAAALLGIGTRGKRRCDRRAGRSARGRLVQPMS